MSICAVLHYLEEIALTSEAHCGGSSISGLRSGHPSSNPSISDSITRDSVVCHLSLCQPGIREIRGGFLDRRFLNFLLRFEKQCFVTILNIGLSRSSASGLFLGSNDTSLEFTLGEGLNELGGTLISRDTSKSSHKFRPRGPMSYGIDDIAIRFANSSWTSRIAATIGFFEW